MSGVKDDKENFMLGEDAGLLVLTAPLSWWPPAMHLHRHPLEALRTFFSAITSAGIAVGAADRMVSLSRLGRSVILSGTLVTSSASSQQVVQLHNPFSGADLHLNVCTKLAECNLASDTLLRSFVEADRVRVQAAEVPPGVPLQELASGLDDESKTLGGRYLLSAMHHIIHQLQHKRRQCAVLFTGEHGVGKTHTMHRVAMRLPPVLDVCGVHFLVECRDLSLVALLQLDEREAVEVIRCVFAPPPVNVHGGTHGVLLVVKIDVVELLGAVSNTLVALVTHELCTVLDELCEVPGFHLVTLATATSTGSIPLTLVARLSSFRVHIICPSLEERLRCVDAHNKPPALFSLRVRTRVAERLAGRTAGELAVTDAATFLQLLRREEALDVSQRDDDNSHGLYDGFIGLGDVIRDLEEFAVWPLLNLPLLRRCGVSSPRGLLLCGPPGSGKTAVLKALMERLRGDNARGVHVILADGLQLLEKEVGRTEKNIAALFASARAMAPTALFFDNIDSLAPPRGRQMSEVSSAADRTLSTLLTEMDGISSSCSSTNVVFVVASAPSVSALDPAISRPGRLDIHLVLPLPGPKELQLYIVRRLVTCIPQFDDAVDTDAVAAAVEAHVCRWINSARHVTVAEANDLVREVVLQLAEGPTTAPISNRLMDALGVVAPL